VQQDHRPSIRVTRFGVADIQHARVDLLERAQRDVFVPVLIAGSFVDLGNPD